MDGDWLAGGPWDPVLRVALGPPCGWSILAEGLGVPLGTQLVSPRG